MVEITKKPENALRTPRYDAKDGSHEDGPYELRLTFKDGHTSSTYASGPLAYRSLSSGYQNWADNADAPQNEHGECETVVLLCAGSPVQRW